MIFPARNRRLAMVPWLSARGSDTVVAVHTRRLSTLRLGGHPNAEIGFGIPDVLPDAVPRRAVTLPSPRAERLNLDAQKVRYLIRIE
jgi:hypothetical protein